MIHLSPRVIKRPCVQGFECLCMLNSTIHLGGEKERVRGIEREGGSETDRQTDRDTDRDSGRERMCHSIWNNNNNTNKSSQVEQQELCTVAPPSGRYGNQLVLSHRLPWLRVALCKLSRVPASANDSKTRIKRVWLDNIVADNIVARTEYSELKH